MELQQTSCVSLEEEREKAEKKMANLRYPKMQVLYRIAVCASTKFPLCGGHWPYREALEGEKRSCAGHIEDLERGHREEVERVRGEEREKGREEKEQVREECHREAQQREMEFLNEVRLVREEEERKKKEAVREEQETHREEMGELTDSHSQTKATDSHTALPASLQNALAEEHGRERESLQAGLQRERETWMRDRQQLDSKREMEVMAVGTPTNIQVTINCKVLLPQVARYQQQLDEMKREGERRGHDLFVTRDSLHNLTEEAKLLRKQLEVRGQELEAAKREASNILR